MTVVCLGVEEDFFSLICYYTMIYAYFVCLWYVLRYLFFETKQNKKGN